jgi:hypothetical protein
MCVNAKERRQQVAKRDGDRCVWCGCSFSEENPSTLDHLIPVGWGGRNYYENSVLACEPCNHERGCRPASFFLWLCLEEGRESDGETIKRQLKIASKRMSLLPESVQMKARQKMFDPHRLVRPGYKYAGSCHV